MDDEEVLASSNAGVDARLIRRNVSVVTVAYVVGAVCGFLALAYLARQLGQAAFGVYVAASALVNIVAVLDSLGGGNYLVRESARGTDRLEQLLADVLLLKVFANVAVLAVSLAAAYLLGFTRTEFVVVAILALTFGANAFSRTLRAGLQSLERMEFASGIAIGNAVLSAAGMIAVVAAGGGLVAAVLVSGAVSVATIPVAWIWLRRVIRIRLRTTLVALRRVTRASVPFAVAGVFTFATTYADVLVINGTLGNRQTGLYGAATRMVLVLQFVPSIYLDSVYRTMSHLAATDRRRLGAFVDRSAAWLCLAALPLAAGGLVVGGRVLTLVFGASFAPATRTFEILLWSLVPGFVGWLLMAAVTVDRPRTAAWIVGVGFVVNLGLNLVLVPRYGIAAAAWLTVVSALLTTVGPAVVMARHGMPVRWPLLALPGLAAAALMAFAIYPLRHAPLAIPVVVGAVVYAAGLVATGVPKRLGLTRDAVRRVLRRRPQTPTQTAG